MVSILLSIGDVLTKVACTVLSCVAALGCGTGALHPRADGAAGGGATGGGGQAGSHSAGDDGCAPVPTGYGEDTGFENCPDGTLRRRAAIQCPWAMETDPISACSGISGGFCQSDADCPPGTSRQPKAYCAQAHNRKGYCGCYTGCREDADCGPGWVCDCNAAFGECVPARCTTNADCGPGSGCVRTPMGQTGSVCNQTPAPITNEYACQTAADTCRTSADCAGAPGKSFCLYDDTRRACGCFTPMPI